MVILAAGELTSRLIMLASFFVYIFKYKDFC